MYPAADIISLGKLFKYSVIFSDACGLSRNSKKAVDNNAQMVFSDLPLLSNTKSECMSKIF